MAMMVADHDVKTLDSDGRTRARTGTEIEIGTVARFPATIEDWSVVIGIRTDQGHLLLQRHQRRMSARRYRSPAQPLLRRVKQ